MNNLQQKSKKRKEESPTTVKENKKSFIIGSLIATFVALTPYYFYIYKYVPEERLWVTSWFTYDSHSWEDANYVMWIFTGKFVPMLLIIVWFLSCRHWWYHVLIVPIAMYIYQIFGLFNENIGYIDEFQLKHLFPLMAIVIPLIYLIRARIFNRINTVEKSVQELEDELKIKPKSVFNFVKQYF